MDDVDLGTRSPQGYEAGEPTGVAPRPGAELPGGARAGYRKRGPDTAGDDTEGEDLGPEFEDLEWLLGPEVSSAATSQVPS